MASTLTGLFKTLTWGDFGTPKPKPEPAAGTTGTAAHTETKAPINYSWSSKGKSFSLADSVTIQIQFVQSQSWVADWVFNRSKQFQDDLLKHEQGHYDITALLARDMFIEIMQLKAKTFASSGELDRAVAAIVKAHSFQPVHNKYDEKSETNHGMNDAQQKTWDALFKKSFTTPRSPAMSAPDGTAYKVPLLEVLKTAGKAPP
jgi:hypothetical protein